MAEVSTDISESEPSLLGIAQSLNKKESKDKNERTKMGENRSALAMGGSKRLNVTELISCMW